MADCMCPPPNATRRQLRQYHRGCLVHAAGETLGNHDCCVTRIYLDPWTSPHDLDDPPAHGVGHAVLALGVRIPRSLRRLYAPR